MQLRHGTILLSLHDSYGSVWMVSIHLVVFARGIFRVLAARNWPFPGHRLLVEATSGAFWDLDSGRRGFGLLVLDRLRNRPDLDDELVAIGGIDGDG
jgi:hypothetical protein